VRGIALGLVVMALAFGPAGCGRASEGRTSGAPLVKDAFVVRPAGSSPAAFYASVESQGAVADTLLEISSDAFEMIMLHTTTNGVMEMVHDLPLPAHGVIALRPGGLHGMLEGPTRPLARGDSVTLTLRFARAAPVVVTARVIDYAEVDHLLPPA